MHRKIGLLAVAAVVMPNAEQAKAQRGPPVVLLGGAGVLDIILGD
jgi:hypothetical protein